MIAASVPSFRPLFKAVLAGPSVQRHTSDQYQYISRKSGVRRSSVPGTTSRDTIFGVQSRGTANTVVSAGIRPGTNDAEEAGAAQVGPQEGITKTTEVVVSVSRPVI